MKKRIALTLALMMAALMIVSCADSSSGTPPASTSATGSSAADGSVAVDDTPRTITFMTVSNFYTTGLEALGRAYTELHPNITFVVDAVNGNDAYLQKYVATQEAGDYKNIPDIIHANITGAASYRAAIERGWMMDMGNVLNSPNPYNEGDKSIAETIPEAWLARALTDGGGVYAHIPFDNVTVSVYYNKDILEEHNIAVPTTLEEWSAAAEKLKEAGYQYPIGASNVASWYLAMLADDVYRKDFAKWGVAEGDAIYNPETMVDANTIEYSETDMNFDEFLVLNEEKLAALRYEEGTFNTPENVACHDKFFEVAQYFQSNWVQPDDAGVSDGFITQNHPFLIHGSWQLGFFNEQISDEFEWGTFSLPPTEDAGKEGSLFISGMRNFMGMGHLLTIVPTPDEGDTAGQTAAVEDFVKFWFSQEGSKLVYEETLNGGYLVQGPPLVDGVMETLPQNFQDMFAGMSSDGLYKAWYNNMVGSPNDSGLEEDKAQVFQLYLDCTAGKITPTQLVEQLDPIRLKKFEDDIAKGGYDLDVTTKDTPRA